MIKAAVISNGLHNLHDYFSSSDMITYHMLPVTANFNPDLTPYDLLVVPNGSDHIAMAKITSKIKNFLKDGKALICVDGWFTNWLPGNQWVMDNSKRSIDLRYTLDVDRYGLFDGVEIDSFIYSNGISGWWSCGYIDAASHADVVVKDTWDRPIIVLDEKSTNGLIFLTASGPLADKAGQLTDDVDSMNDMARLYQNVIRLVAKNQKQNPLQVSLK